MIIVPKSGTFALIIEEKQGKVAKATQIKGTTVSKRLLGDARKEHLKLYMSLMMPL
jgi:hypothetical protein